MTMISKKEHCIALLALHFQQKPDSPANAGPLPSGEELGALCGTNGLKLDALRRQQLLKHIAHDERVYKLWLQVIEYDHDHESPANTPVYQEETSSQPDKEK